MISKGMFITGAVALATSSAFAAGFDVNAGQDALADISTGTVSVDDCTGGLLLDVVPGDYDATQDDWSVAAVRVTAAGATTLDEGCAGFLVSAAIEHGSNVTAAFGDVATDAAHLIAVGDEVVELTPDGTVWVSDVSHVAVLVDEPNL